MTFTFHGRHGRGYLRTLRELKREEAEQRNAMTPEHRRSKKNLLLEAR